MALGGGGLGLTHIAIFATHDEVFSAKRPFRPWPIWREDRSMAQKTNR